MVYHAVIDESSKVINVVIWDGKSQWHPGPGKSTVPCYNNEGSIGDTYDPETKSFKKS
jgi:hypothetical protein